MKDEIEHILETASFADAEARAECERRVQAALDRAEAAEAEVKRLEALELARVNANQRAERAERQRDEAWTKGAEAMREACLVAAEASYGFDVSIWLEETKHGMVARIAEAIVDAIRALPIPAQEVK